MILSEEREIHTRTSTKTREKIVYEKSIFTCRAHFLLRLWNNREAKKNICTPPDALLLGEWSKEITYLRLQQTQVSPLCQSCFLCAFFALIFFTRKKYERKKEVNHSGNNLKKNKRTKRSSNKETGRVGGVITITFRRALLSQLYFQPNLVKSRKPSVHFMLVCVWAIEFNFTLLDHQSLFFT